MFRSGLIAACLITACLPFSAGAQPIAALESKVTIVAPRSLTANQADAFEKFVNDGRYNGAFYVSQNGGFHWRANLNSLAAAKRLTGQVCNLNGRNCQIYATLTPKSARLSKTIEGLSQTAARDAEAWARENTKGGRSVAIAASGYAGWAGWRGKSSAAKLRSSALNHCGDLLRQRIKRLEAKQREALEQEGLLRCKIIFTQPTR